MRRRGDREDSQGKEETEEREEERGREGEERGWETEEERGVTGWLWRKIQPLLFSLLPFVSQFLYLINHHGTIDKINYQFKDSKY